MHWASFLRIIFALLVRAWARAGSELGRFSMKAELLREINGRFLLNEFGTNLFFILHDLISKLEEFFIIQFSEKWGLIHYYNLILDVSLKASRRSTCLLFDYFHFNGNLKAFYCNIAMLSQE